MWLEADVTSSRKCSPSTNLPATPDEPTDGIREVNQIEI
jgi:hypothetical protein